MIVSALRSQRGASFRLFMLADSGKFRINLSVTLLLEYEQAARRLVGQTPLTHDDVDDIIDYLCEVAIPGRVFYLWRPMLSDPDDDMVLELAIAANCEGIVTFNKSDFRGAEQFGVRLWTPREFLQEIGELP